MLVPSRRRQIRRKVDWFPTRGYLHLDLPISRRRAERLVTDPHAVVTHAFLPLMSFAKRQRRFKNTPSGQTSTTKVRPLAYASNRDNCVYSYYAHVLGSRYETVILGLGLDDVVLAYRKGPSNIGHAHRVFEEIRARVPCTALAFDIKSFFDCIDHVTLKRNWARVLGVATLPPDHYAVFKALTRFSKVDRRELLARLGFPPKTKDVDLPRPLCSISEFRRLRRDKTRPRLVEVNAHPYGIPQGTALSAVAANIAMLDFDLAMMELMRSVGGLYRRYSDDILVICPAPLKMHVKKLTVETLRATTATLHMNPDKTEIVDFRGRGHRASLQYLGFIFDGTHTSLRSSTLARYGRRLTYAIRFANRQQRLAASGDLSGRPVVYRRDLYAKFTHLGADNFVTSYVQRAKQEFGNRIIGRQVTKIARRMLKDL